MKLELDSGCTERTSWRVELPRSAIDAATRGLVAAGMREDASPPGLVCLVDARRTRVLIVTKTGRCQIRVDVDVPRASRRHEAERVFALLLRAAQA